MEEQARRNGIHRYLHISRLDTYFYAFFSIGLFSLVALKVLNRIMDLGIDTSIISWVNALQLAVLWAILGFVSHEYYTKHEQKYDK